MFYNESRHRGIDDESFLRENFGGSSFLPLCTLLYTPLPYTHTQTMELTYCYQLGLCIRIEGLEEERYIQLEEAWYSFISFL